MSMMESYDGELKFISELCDSELVASLKGHLGIPGQCHLGPLSHSNVLVPASSDHKYRDLYDNEYSLIHQVPPISVLRESRQDCSIHC